MYLGRSLRYFGKSVWVLGEVVEVLWVVESGVRVLGETEIVDVFLVVGLGVGLERIVVKVLGRLFYKLREAVLVEMAQNRKPSLMVYGVKGRILVTEHTMLLPQNVCTECGCSRPRRVRDSVGVHHRPFIKYPLTWNKSKTTS